MTNASSCPPIHKAHVLILADDPLERAGLAALLSDAPSVTVTGQSSGDVHLAALLAAFQPNVLLWDLGWCPTTRWNDNYYISFGDWLAGRRYSAGYDVPEKVVIRQTGDSLIATLDTDQFVVRDNLYTIVSKNNGLKLAYILGLLNSKLLNWLYQNALNPEKGEALAQVKRGHLAQLPIRTIDCADPADVARHERMVALVEQMLALHRQRQAARTPHEQSVLDAQIAATDRQMALCARPAIDRLVYELYELTEEEIQIVEGG